MAVIGNAPFQGLVSGGNIIDASIEGVDLSTSAIAARLGYTPVDPGAAAIIGGTINGTTIGATTAASGRFTTVSTSGAVTLNGLTASTALALDASKNLVSVTNTGSGNNVLATSPTLVTPVLGTPTSGNFSTGTFTWPTFNQSTTGTAAGLSATLATASGGTGLTSFTSGGVVYASSTSALATGSALTFDGTNLGVGTANPLSKLNAKGTQGNWRIDPDSVSSEIQLLTTTVANDGFRNYRIRSNEIIFDTNGSEAMRLTSTSLYTATGISVGIGTTNPTAQLEIGRSSTSGYSTLRLSNSGTSGRTYEIGLGGNTAAAGYANNLYFYDSTAAVNRMVLTSAGNLGVGTSNTDARVDAEVSSGNAYRAYKSTTGGFTAYRLYTSNENVIGTIGVSSTNDNFYLGYGTTPVLTWNSSGTVTINGGGLNLGSGGTNGYFSGGTWYGINSGDWSFQAGNGSQNFIWKNSSGSSLMTLDTSGRLLIGTTNADVGGSVDGTVIRPTTGIATAISTTDFYSYTIYADRRGTNNTGKILAMGLGGYLKASIGVVGSNNTANDGGITFNTIYNNDTQVQQMRIDVNGVIIANETKIQGLTVGRGAGVVATNTAVGYEAGYNNASGDYLTVVGYQAGKGNTSGRFNTALGNGALLTNSTSNDNTAVGNAALKLTVADGNTAVGSNVLGVNTSGAYNTGVGNNAFARHTSGPYNVGVGADVLSYNTTGGRNTALGYQAGFSNTFGYDSTFIGHKAGFLNTTAAGNDSRNTAVGALAGYTNSTGTQTVYVGYKAGQYATGGYNTGVGYQAAQGANGTASGEYNTGVGGAALAGFTSGERNTAVGVAALASTNSGSYNTAVGMYALLYNTTASSNTAVGYQAAQNFNGPSGINTYVGYQAGFSSTGANTSDYGNTFVGYQAGYSVANAGGSQTGIYNTFIGTSAGYAVTTGSKNTILGGFNGNSGGLDIRTANNYIVLSDGDGNPRCYWTTTGVMIQSISNTDNFVAQFVNSTATRPYGMYINFSAATPNNTTERFLQCSDSTNEKCTIFSSGTVTNRTGTYNAFSDIKLKQDVVDASSQWDDIKAVRVRKFRLKDDVVANPEAKPLIGVIAQELELTSAGLIDDCIDKEGDVTKSVKYSILYMKAIKALQEAMERIEQLEARLDAANL